MDVRIIHNGSNITKQVVSYETNHKLCNSTGQLTLTVEPTTASAMNTWDTVNVYESYHRGEYFISSIQDNIPDGKAIITCQDASKKLVDTFIEESYTFEDTLEYTGTWINKFLHDAGVTGNAGTGQLMSNYSELGLKSVMAQVTELLQMSGWYMYFSDSNTAVIGKISKDFSNYDFLFDETELLNVVISKNDKMLRNRAVVMGGYDPFLGTTVIADGRTHTPWNYDHGDLRTAVVSNSNIPNMKSAKKIATDMINEFAHLTVEKHLVVAGLHNVRIGDVVAVNSKAYRGAGIVTTVGTSVSREGAVTNIILDERCPRLFAFFDFGDYVYIGTDGDGVWRKHIFYTHTWEDFSSGLIDKHITDLHIANGVMTCVTSNGDVYKRFPDSSSWSKIVLPSMETWLESESGGWGSGYIPGSEIKARASVVDRQTGKIYIACDTNYNDNEPFYEDNFKPWPSGESPSDGIYEFNGISPEDGDRAWVYTEGGDSTPMVYRDSYDLRAWDMETSSNGIKFASLTTLMKNDYDFGFYNSRGGFYDSQHTESFDSMPTTVSGSPSHINMNTYGFLSAYDEIDKDGNLGSGTCALYSNVNYISAHKVYSYSGSEYNSIVGVVTTLNLTFSNSYEVIATSQKVTGYDDHYNIYTVELPIHDGSSNKDTIKIRRYTIDIGAGTASTGSIVMSHVSNKVGGFAFVGRIAVVEGEIAVLYYDVDESGGDDIVVYSLDGDHCTTDCSEIRTKTDWLGNVTEYYCWNMNGDTARLGIMTYDTRTGYQYITEKALSFGDNFIDSTFGQNGSKIEGIFAYTSMDEYSIDLDDSFDQNDVYNVTIGGISINLLIMDRHGGEKVKEYSSFTKNYPYNWMSPYYALTVVQPSKDTFSVSIVNEDADEEAIYVYGTGSSVFHDEIKSTVISAYNLQNFECITQVNDHGVKTQNMYYPNTLVTSGKIVFNGEYDFVDFLNANDINEDGFFTNSTYVIAKDTNGTYGVGKLSGISYSISDFVPFPDTFDPPHWHWVGGKLVGNFVIVSVINPEDFTWITHSFYFYNGKMGRPSVVMGVDGDRNLLEVHQSNVPSRLDVSLYSPLYVVDRDAMSQSAYYIYNGGDVVGYHNWSYSGIAPYADLIDDFRYMPYAATSGELSELVAMYSVEGNAYYADMLTFSEVSGIILYSGIQMLETTNYMPPDQTIFASVSGGAGFYQKDVNSSVFESRTDALPSSPITIIRVDDRL